MIVNVNYVTDKNTDIENCRFNSLTDDEFLD